MATSGAFQQTQLYDAVNTLIASYSGESLKLHLFTNSSLAPTPTTPLGSFDEPVGAWYSAADATFGDTWIDAAGNVNCNISSIQYTNTSSPTSNESIFGWYMSYTVSSNTYLVGAGLLAQGPQTMGATDSAVIVDAGFSFPPIDAH